MHLLHFPSYNPSWWIHITSHEIYLFTFIHFHYNRILAKMQDDTGNYMILRSICSRELCWETVIKLILTKVNYKFSVEALRLCPMAFVNFGWHCDSWVMYLNILKPPYCYGCYCYEVNCHPIAITSWVWIHQPADNLPWGFWPPPTIYRHVH